jgi:uncharacterized membrane protein
VGKRRCGRAGSAGALESGARGINDRGEIVGYARRPETGFHARGVIWENGVMRSLNLPAPAGCTVSACSLSYYSSASAINDDGMISGSAASEDEIVHAVRWLHDGTGAVLATLPGATGSQANMGSINNRGDVAGYSDVLRNGVFTQAATLWTADGRVQALPTLLPSAASSLAMAIGNHGHVAGAASVSELHVHAMLWRLAPIDLGLPGLPF